MLINGYYVELLPLTTGVSASTESDVFDVTRVTGYAIQASWSNQVALAGTIKLSASNDQNVWDDIANSSVTLAGNGTYLWNVTSGYYRYVKVVITINAGSADFLITAQCKD